MNSELTPTPRNLLPVRDKSRAARRLLSPLPVRFSNLQAGRGSRGNLRQDLSLQPRSRLGLVDDVQMALDCETMMSMKRRFYSQQPTNTDSRPPRTRASNIKRACRYERHQRMMWSRNMSTEKP